MTTRYTGRRVRSNWVSSAVTPEIYLTDSYVLGWNGSIAPPAGYDHAADLIIGHAGFIGYFDANLHYTWASSGPYPSLSSLSYVAKSSGSDPTTFGARPSNPSLEIYCESSVGIGTLLSSGEPLIDTGMGSGFFVANQYTNMHAARNVYRGTDPARRVIGDVNTDRTASDQSTVVVPGVTAPSNNSLLICFVNSYASSWFWYEDGDVNDDWIRPAGQVYQKHLMWKLVPAGPTGDLSFTMKLGGTTYTAGKRQLFFVCIDSDTTP